MKDNIREMLDEEIADLYGELKELDPESDEYSTVKNHVISLHKLRIDDEHENDRLTDKLKLGLEAAGIVLPLIFYAYWMKKGFEFEKDGTFTSTTFRGLFNRFRPAK